MRKPELIRITRNADGELRVKGYEQTGITTRATEEEADAIVAAALRNGIEVADERGRP